MAEHNHKHSHEHTHSHGQTDARSSASAFLPKFQKRENGKGVFYGVGVGPGDTELLTLKAVRTIMHCPIIAAPRTKDGSMLAFDIAKKGVSTFLAMSFGSRMAEASEESFWSAKRLLAMDFPMTKDKAVLRENYRSITDSVKAYLDQGLDVAMLNLGDVSLYSTYSHIAVLLEQDGYHTEMVAGVTSYSASAAALGISLTRADTPVQIIPGAAGVETVNRLLDEDGTKILMKTRKGLAKTLALLHEKELSAYTSVVVNCGLPGEELYETLTEYENALQNTPDTTDSYFTTFIVKDGEES